MFGEDYAYAVARIRVLETGLLNQAAMNSFWHVFRMSSSAADPLQRRAGKQ